MASLVSVISSAFIPEYVPEVRPVSAARRSNADILFSVFFSVISPVLTGKVHHSIFGDVLNFVEVGSGDDSENSPAPPPRSDTSPSSSMPSPTPAPPARFDTPSSSPRPSPTPALPPRSDSPSSSPRHPRLRVYLLPAPALAALTAFGGSHGR
eukprot:CAMPEP_0172597906 /NCGR_PEP_ID=MMETSP1068-20121228/17887_1 /TAXON_ID=35684 /ORGANISM="Pseudopedinella elastica, Strain CCMP716" /LENGTH=152 /DNA_ID=CAMNT_0013397561 /DNA_START=210 /DNA_END=666 /DNA_ORIENTATION=+